VISAGTISFKRYLHLLSEEVHRCSIKIYFFSCRLHVVSGKVGILWKRSWKYMNATEPVLMVMDGVLVVLWTDSIA